MTRDELLARAKANNVAEKISKLITNVWGEFNVKGTTPGPALSAFDLELADEQDPWALGWDVYPAKDGKLGLGGNWDAVFALVAAELYPRSHYKMDYLQKERVTKVMDLFFEE